LICKLCEWVNARFGARYGPDCDREWEELDAWERERSNDSDLWSREPDGNRELLEQAWALETSDPQAAFQLYLRAADAGSPWALQMVGWHYHTGTWVAADLERAQAHYYQAICAGSWSATISYARLLAEQGHFDACEQVLEDGIRSDFIPAYFWLARVRFNRSGSRQSCRRIRPLLEYASERGHPGARRLLAVLQLLGKFGIRQIPTGYRSLVECMRVDDGEDAVGGQKPAEPGPARPAAAAVNLDTGHRPALG
jgi:hypothetical protein